MDESKLDLLLKHSTDLMDEMKSIKVIMEKLDDRIGTLETKVSSLEAKVSGLEAKVSGLETKVSGLEIQIKQQGRQLRNLELTLENETNPNIRIIAEGHVDVIRKLDESLKISHESEIYQIRVNKLDNEIRKIKEFYQNQSLTQRTAAN